jgi:hypothetical protein
MVRRHEPHRQHQSKKHSNPANKHHAFHSG